MVSDFVCCCCTSSARQAQKVRIEKKSLHVLRPNVVHYVHVHVLLQFFYQGALTVKKLKVGSLLYFVIL
jgi:hypothetical protein